MSAKPTPITDPVLYANVGSSIYWTPEQWAAAEANLLTAAATHGMTRREYVEFFAPRPRRV